MTTVRKKKAEREKSSVEPPSYVHKSRPGTTGVLCGAQPPLARVTTSTNREDTTCPACLRLWIDLGVAKAMAGGDSAARFGGPPPETEFEG